MLKSGILGEKIGKMVCLSEAEERLSVMNYRGASIMLFKDEEVKSFIEKKEFRGGGRGGGHKVPAPTRCVTAQPFFLTAAAYTEAFMVIEMMSKTKVPPINRRVYC